MRRLVCSIVLVGCLVLAGPAAARPCVAPPGTAAVDQYCETIPTAAGDRGATPGATQAQRPVPAATLRRLERSEAGAELARQLGGRERRAELRERRDGAVAGENGVAGSAVAGGEAPGGNPLDAVGAAISSGATISGAPFGLLMLALTLAVAGAGWLRVRRQH